VLHRRLRPEAFAQRVDGVARRSRTYPIHDDVLSSQVVDALPHGNLLLPLAYPEGAPAHPSYPAGHAAIAGACVTVLKAFFREDLPFPAAVRPADDGRNLTPYEGPPLTIGGELNKLASNISIARNFAGVHYRSDAVEGMKLGESVAISYLADIRACLTEEFDGFSLTAFDGAATIV
jgi:membrane-associated phospholipid phosphatase